MNAAENFITPEMRERVARMETRRAELIQIITKAFEGVSREGGVSLRETQVIDAYGTDAERKEARKLDTDTCWQEVPLEDIASTDAVLPFLDPIGFRYYLPAYLVAELNSLQPFWPQDKHGELEICRSDPQPWDDTFSHLNYHPAHKYLFDSKRTVLNLQQLMAVKEFLEFWRDETEESME